MLKFLNFMEKRRDPFLKIKLTDLARTLADSKELDVSFAFHSYYKKGEHAMTVSNYWDELADNRKEEAMKSDIYLRAYGNMFFTNYNVVTHFLNWIEEQAFPQFLKHLFCLLEDLRIEKLCIANRPGMEHAFTSRRELFIKRFRERYTIHKNKMEWLDALFCAIYLQIAEKPVSLPGHLSEFKPVIRTLKSDIETCSSTSDTATLAYHFNKGLQAAFTDMKASYFTMYKENTITKHEAHHEMENKASLESHSSKNYDQKAEEDSEDETLPTWHEESTDEDNNNFLQFDLDRGEKSDLIGEGERKMEEGDQAFASVEGSSQDSDGANFDGDALASENKQQPTTQTSNTQVYGEANRHATLITKKRNHQTVADQQGYQQLKASIQPMLKPLQQSIQKTIEAKYITPRTDLHFGRLNKKLLKVVTDDLPRLFYKKSEPSRQLDVTFTLLVDCSASMADKMEQTKAGLVLFHETLQNLKIPHRIVGFWEDALDADDHEQPNYMYEVIPFDSSLLPKQGPYIMQLEPEEDNRDGYVIRQAAEAMATRSEKHKLLLVFTDGEPSAFDYTENGIVDTHEAVTAVRKSKTEVIGVFLSNGDPQEREKETMKHIYGRQSLIIPSVEDIPTYLTPLLKKLLLQYT